jgi:hypothetical protein
VASDSLLGRDRRFGAQTSTLSTSSPDVDQSATRTDLSLLIAALFLERFSLPFHNTRLQLDLVAIGIILVSQFLRGRLLIQYDRLLWFLPFAAVTTFSRFNGGGLTSYAQTIVFFSLFALVRQSTPDQYKTTLHSFQFLVLLLSCIGIAQVPAQLVVPYDKLVNLFDVVPAFSHLEAPAAHFRANGIFLSEASSLSQISALGILVEILTFRRPGYLIVLTLGFLVSYSGTGSLVLLLFLPLAGLSNDKASLPVLLVVIFALGLLATGIIDSYALTNRVYELQSPGSSGYARFVSPFILAGKEFDTGELQEILFGNGPGTAKVFASSWVNVWYTGGFTTTWLKILYENGIIGSFVFACFLTSCFRKSRCPGVVIAAIIFSWLFVQGIMTITIALCTLNGPSPRRHGIEEISGDRSPLAVEAKTI